MKHVFVFLAEVVIGLLLAGAVVPLVLVAVPPGYRGPTLAWVLAIVCVLAVVGLHRMMWPPEDEERVPSKEP